MEMKDENSFVYLGVADVLLQYYTCSPSEQGQILVVACIKPNTDVMYMKRTKIMFLASMGWGS